LAIAKQMHADNPSDDSKEVLDLCENGLADAEHKLEQALARLAPLQDQLPEEPQEVKAPEPELPKFDPQNHPVLKKSIEKTEETPAVALRTGDMCEAFWRDDRKWYKAKILTILGSASNPQYKVKFVEYSDTPTLERDQVRPLTVHQHKKKQEEPAAAPAAPVTSTPHVISAPAVANPKAIATPEIMSDAAPAKKRNIPNRKTLDKSVGSWKDWNSKGVGKKIAQKESMFRSGTTVESRGKHYRSLHSNC
jgi:survival-of-motor-neuron-related-splicing factor 30